MNHYTGERFKDVITNILRGFDIMLEQIHYLKKQIEEMDSKDIHRKIIFNQEAFTKGHELVKEEIKRLGKIHKP